MGLGTPPITCMSSMSTSQPLPSNVLSKQQSAMDQQYMQQSSQIFVFSTQWANKAAQAVMEGAYPTIICWHENQNETKKHLAVRIAVPYWIALKHLSVAERSCEISKHGEKHHAGPG